ncbi:hypothetical protein D3C72_542860 [compost metagenome]
MARAVGQTSHTVGASRDIAAQFNAEGAFHQGVFGGQQGIDARGQTLDPGRNNDLLAEPRLGVAIDGVRRDRGSVGRHNGVDLVVRMTQAVEGRADVGQGRLQHVDRTAATGDETGAGGDAAARQIQNRALVRAQRAQHHDPLLGIGALQLDAVKKPLQAVGRPAVGNDQVPGADRGQAAGQQVDLAGRDRGLLPPCLARLQLVGTGHELVAAHAKGDRAQRRPQHAALIDDVRPDRQRSIERQRRRGRHAFQLVEADRAAGDQRLVADGVARNTIGVLAGVDRRDRAGDRIDLGGGQGDVAHRIDLAAGHADVAAADDVDLAVGGVLVFVLTAARQADRAVHAELGPAHVDQPALDGQDAVAHVGNLEQGLRPVLPADQIIASHRPRRNEAHIGGAQARVLIRAVAQRTDRPRQGQVARQVQVHRTVQQDHVRRVERQTAETARRDLIHADARLADQVRNAFIGRGGVGVQLARRPAPGDAVAVLQIRRQAAVLLCAEDDAAQTAHIVGHVARAGAQLHQIGRGQLDRQQAAGCARSARMSAHVAVQEDAVLRLEADRAAIGGDRQALPVLGESRGQIVDLGRRARGVQHRAGTHHHIGRALPANRNLAAPGDMTVTQAVGADSADAPARHVDDALFTQPQGRGRIINDVGGLEIEPLVLFTAGDQRHLAAARLDAAVDPHALHRRQVDRLAVVDADARAFDQHQFADRTGIGHGGAVAGHPVAVAQPVGRQAEARALTLDEAAVGRVLAQHVRRPQFQRVLQGGAAGETCAVGGEATDRGADVDVPAHLQIAARTDIVAREAGLEEVGVQVQRLGHLDGRAEHGPGRDGAAHRQDQVGLKDVPLGVGEGQGRNADPVRPDVRRDDKARWRRAIAELQIGSGRDDVAGVIGRPVGVIGLEAVRHGPVAGQGDRREVQIGVGRQRLARLDPVDGVGVVERQGLARLQHHLFDKLQVHRRRLAGRQFVAAVHHSPADGDRTPGGRDRQRAARVLARAIGANGAVQRHLPHVGARFIADRQAHRAALGPDRLAVQQDGGAGRDVDQAVLAQRQVALTTFQHDRSAFQMGQVADVAPRLHVHPQAAGVQRHALADLEVRDLGAARAAGRNRRQRYGAAARRDVGVDRDGLATHGQFAAVAQSQIALDPDLAAIDPQPA